MNEITNNKIVIKRKDGSIYYILISKEDILKIQKRKWCLLKTNRQIYVRSTKRKSCLFLHQYLLPTKSPYLFVDHINRNTLDNRRSNLRLVSRFQNGWNMKLRSDNRSGYKGVHWFKKTKKWCARISVMGKRISLGHYCNLKDAIRVRKCAENKYHII